MAFKEVALAQPSLGACACWVGTEPEELVTSVLQLFAGISQGQTWFPVKELGGQGSVPTALTRRKREIALPPSQGLADGEQRKAGDED